MVAHEVLPVNKVFLAVVFKSGTCESKCTDVKPALVCT